MNEYKIWLHRICVRPSDHRPVSLTGVWKNRNIIKEIYEKFKVEGCFVVLFFFTCVFIDGKIFQNRSVSSPAPVTIVCKRLYLWDSLKEEVCSVPSTSGIRTCSYTWPSGDIARYSTLIVCPVRVATYWGRTGNRFKPENLHYSFSIVVENKQTFPIDGYFHTIIWFWEYPCVLTSSFTFLLHARLQTWTKFDRVYQKVEKLWESVPINHTPSPQLISWKEFSTPL